MKLKFAQRALNEIERGKREWLARRDKNPELFESKLAEALENITAVPALGSPTDIVSRGQWVRRVEMRKTKYQVYYRGPRLHRVRLGRPAWHQAKAAMTARAEVAICRGSCAGYLNHPWTPAALQH